MEPRGPFRRYVHPDGRGSARHRPEAQLHPGARPNDMSSPVCGMRVYSRLRPGMETAHSTVFIESVGLSKTTPINCCVGRDVFIFYIYGRKLYNFNFIIDFFLYFILVQHFGIWIGHECRRMFVMPLVSESLSSCIYEGSYIKCCCGQNEARKRYTYW